MTTFGQRPAVRWLVPLLAAFLLAVGGSAAGALTASARDALPQRSASQLLTDVATPRLAGLSGTIVQTADLGLPALPGVGQANSSEMSSLISGSHKLRLWYAGPSQVRLALLGSLGESDVVRNGRDLWTWSSTQRTATHRTLPATGGRAPDELGSTPATTPQQAAEAALQVMSASTKVSVDGTAVVAGRSAYELVLEPRDTSSLVASVRVAVDAATHVPVRVQVFAQHGSQPAFEVGFTSFDPTVPDSSVFAFAPPPGTKVTESGSSAHGTPHGPVARLFGSMPGHDAKVVGSGWTSVVVVKTPSDQGPGGGSLADALSMLPRVSGSWGAGHLLRGTLFSALLTDDGTLVAGAVPPGALYAALAR